MRGINKVTLMGNLGKEPDIKQLDNNTLVAKLAIATNEIFKTAQGEKQVKTTWHTVVAWRAIAELANKYLHKGSHVYIDGHLSYRQYTDKTGQEHYVTEIIADNLIMLDKKVEE